MPNFVGAPKRVASAIFYAPLRGVEFLSRKVNQHITAPLQRFGAELATREALVAQAGRLGISLMEADGRGREPNVIVSGMTGTRTHQGIDLSESQILETNKEVVKPIIKGLVDAKTKLDKLREDYKNKKFGWIKASIIAGLVGAATSAVLPVVGALLLPISLHVGFAVALNFLAVGGLTLGYQGAWYKGITKGRLGKIGREMKNARKALEENKAKLVKIFEDEQNRQYQDALASLLYDYTHVHNAPRIAETVKQIYQVEAQIAEAKGDMEKKNQMKTIIAALETKMAEQDAMSQVQTLEELLKNGGTPDPAIRDKVKDLTQRLPRESQAAQSLQFTYSKFLPGAEESQPASKEEQTLSDFTKKDKVTKKELLDAATTLRQCQEVWATPTDEQKALLEAVENKVRLYDPVLLIGQTFTSDLTASTFVITERLGKGGMGMVYKVRGIKGKFKDKDLVVKLPALWMLKDLEYADRAIRQNPNDAEIAKKRAKLISLMGRFKGEAEQLYGQIKHPNIISVLDYGESKELKIEGIRGNIAYYIAEFIDGVTLEKIAEKKIDVTVIVSEIMIPLLRAFKNMHLKGIIHRDVKPSNIMVRSRADGTIDRAFLIDFGAYRPEGGNETLTGDRVGTPKWMDPDYLAKGVNELTPKSDLYSFALTIYKTITGEEVYETLATKPASLWQLPFATTNVKKGVLNVLDRMFQKLYESHDDIIRDLDTWVENATTDQDKIKRITHAPTVDVNAQEAQRQMEGKKSPPPPPPGSARTSAETPSSREPASEQVSVVSGILEAPKTIEDALALLQDIEKTLFTGNPEASMLDHINDQLAEIMNTPELQGNEYLASRLGPLMIRVSDLQEQQGGNG